MNPLPLLSQEKHDPYLSRATTEVVCMAVLFMHLWSDFFLFLLEKGNVLYTQPAFSTSPVALDLVFQTSEIKTVILLPFLFYVVEKLVSHTDSLKCILTLKSQFNMKSPCFCDTPFQLKQYSWQHSVGFSDNWTIRVICLYAACKHMVHIQQNMND